MWADFRRSTDIVKKVLYVIDPIFRTVIAQLKGWQEAKNYKDINMDEIGLGAQEAFYIILSGR